jgi:hypothetical protein
MPIVSSAGNTIGVCHENLTGFSPCIHSSKKRTSHKMAMTSANARRVVSLSGSKTRLE